MDIKIVMPVPTYHAFLGRCVLPGREYAILRNSVIDHIPGTSPGDWVEILCHRSEAERLLHHALRLYPAAAPYIERSIAAYSIHDHEPALRYRKSAAGDTWHFVVTCSQWPVVSFIEHPDPPRGHELCNECIVKHQQQKSNA